jgi:ribonuclease HIII
VKVGKDEVEKLVELIKREGGREERAPEHARGKFRFKEGVVTVYQSGAVVVGGKEKEELKERVFKLIKELYDASRFPIVGCDEAGKGELFGPLVVACLYADRKCYERLLKLGGKDSKRLDREKIASLSREIMKSCHGVVKVLMPKEYNELYRRYGNLNVLLEELYVKALERLLKKREKPKLVVVDKFSSTLEERLKNEFPQVKFKVVPRAEEEPAVAAAALVAKGVRLEKLKELEEKFGIKLKEGSMSNRELLMKLPKEKRPFLIKEHFKVKGEEK